LASESLRRDPTFEEAVSIIVHNKLVNKTFVSLPTQIDKNSSQVLPKASRDTATACPSNTTTKVQSLSVVKEAESSATTPMDTEVEDIIVRGTKHKRLILQEYQDRFGTDVNVPIVTRKKGKTIAVPTNNPSVFPTIKRMKPRRSIYYRVEELTLYNVITTVLKEYLGSFTPEDQLHLSCVNKDFATMIPNTKRWLSLDFSSLRDPIPDYELQTTISQHRVDMASAAMVHFGLDIGRFVRWLGGEYTNEHHDFEQTLMTVKEHISEEDYNHLVRIFYDGCPAELVFEEKLSNKMIMIERGNSKSFIENPELVKTKLAKEVKYSHVLPMHPLICTFSPTCRHTTQTLVMKEGKDPRLAWDGSTKKLPSDITMNDVTPIHDEPVITFGSTKLSFLTDIYNARVSYPGVPILLGMADIKACYRFPAIHPDATGAFGFLADDFYFAAAKMVFGSVISASSWEPIRRSIEVMSAVYANRPDLVERHRHYLDMISWEVPDPSVLITPAIGCPLNPGLTLDLNGNTNQPARMFVDDSLMLALYRRHMEMVLAAIIEAIFVLMGRPNPALRQCPLAQDKWKDLVIKTVQTMLGLNIDTNKLTVAIPHKYVAEVRMLIDTTWNIGRKSFTVQEAQLLTGKLGHLAQGAQWLFHQLTHFYADIATALATNKEFLTQSSQEFRNITYALRTNTFYCSSGDLAKHVSFALKQAAQLVHHNNKKHWISKNMRLELEFFRENLGPDSDIIYETPIAHIVERTPTATAFGDSSLMGMGGYSLDLGYFWHEPVPMAVQLRTLLHKENNDDGQLVSINVLEFATVFINYCAALHVLTTTKFTEDPYPVLLSITDNTSALSWTLKACRTSNIGRLLARLFSSFLINSPLGINSKWISTHENLIADEISRLQSLLDEFSHLAFDYSKIQQKFPQLTHCSFFQLQPKLVSLIWQIVLSEKWPDHNEIKLLKQLPLGKLTSSFGATL